MKKSFLSLALTLILCLGLAASVWSLGGSESDPAVSLSYLEEVWGLSLKEEAQGAIRLTLEKEKQERMLLLADTTAKALQKQEQSNAGARSALGRVLLKEGDSLLLKQGTKILLLDGSLAGGENLANITQGALRTDAAFAPKHTYMQRSDASALITVTSPTAEVWMDGTYVLKASSAVDYGSMAQGLSNMGLFRGMTDGFILQGETTRAQGLVMFLRLLGLEEEALATTASSPFTDVPRGHWAYPYVAYAYEKGLTSGTSQTAFSPNAAVTAQHYLTFLMRALHYAEGTAFTYQTALSDAVQHGLFNQTELDLFSQGSLQRYKMVYLSYYGLFAIDLQEGQMLMDILTENGTMTEEALSAGIAAVKSPRMG